MEYKRLEIYVGWTCNQKCTYCIEYPNMEIVWNKKVTKQEILKTIIKYKKKGFNHVTFLGGEPFIQPVFLYALKLAKTFGFSTLVTTNATTLHIDKEAKKYLYLIDELILSMKAIDKDNQNRISRVSSYAHWNEVFENIDKYWKGKMLKVNIVVVPGNLHLLSDMVEYLNQKNIKQIALTYPDIQLDYYGKDHVIENIAPKYSKCMEVISDIIIFCEKYDMNIKLPDFPFCVFPPQQLTKYIAMTDDFDYQIRTKIDHEGTELDRLNTDDADCLPRLRHHCEKCRDCIYIDKCWGVSTSYDELYGLEEINPIKR